MKIALTQDHGARLLRRLFLLPPLALMVSAALTGFPSESAAAAGGSTPRSEEAAARTRPPAAGIAEGDDQSPNIEALITAAINDANAKVTVRRVGADKYAAVLSGKLSSPHSVMQAGANAEKLINTANLKENVFLINTMESLPADKPEIMAKYVWSFGYLQGDSKFDGKITLQGVTDALNGLFPVDAAAPPIATLKDTNLWLQGPQSKVRQIRALLAFIDAPAPQVRLEMWAIQYAGSQADIGERMRHANDEITLSKSQVEMAKRAIALAIHKHAPAINDESLFKSLRAAGFDVNPASSMSLIESLICLGLANERVEVLNDAKEILAPQLAGLHTAKPKSCVCALPQAQLFPHLTALVANSKETHTEGALDSDQKSIQEFLDALGHYIVFVDAIEMYGPRQLSDSLAEIEKWPLAPEKLASSSVAMNRHIDHLVTAFSDDMREMFFDPLLEAARKGFDVRGGGVGLAGKTSVVVTSRLHASVTPELETYAEKSVPKTLGDDFFNSVFPGKQSSDGGQPSAGSASGAAGVAEMVANLSTLEKAFVLGALQSPTDSSFFKVSPGIAVSVTPAMTPDGTTADLNLDVSFGVDTNISKDSSTTTLAYRPPDAVKKHEVQTVANVGGFNLFEVSSFNMDTIVPRAPFVFPVLGNLPLIGTMFRFGHKPNQTFHQSIILVNATLVPRSLGLVGFYGGNQGGQHTVRAAFISEDGKTKTSRSVYNLLNIK